MNIVTRMYADGPLWAGSEGLFAYHIQFSYWPTTEAELEEAVFMLDHAKSSLQRHASRCSRANSFTGFDGIDIIDPDQQS